MADNMSNWLEGELVDYIFLSGTFTQPTVLAVALLTELANDTSTGQFSVGTGTENTSVGGYLRVDHAAGVGNWNDLGTGVTNNGAIQWALATADYQNPPIVGVVIADTVSVDSGNIYFHGSIVNATVKDNDQFQFADTALQVDFL